MSDSSLILRDDSQLDAVITVGATALKTAALESASLICRVTNATQQELAVAAQVEIKRVLKLVEDSRTEVKAPVLDFGRKIDTLAKNFVAELKTEEIRIARLVGDFQTLQLANARAAEASRKAELDELERRKQQELAQAQNHEQLDAIQHRYNEEAKSLPVVAPVRAASQRVEEDWDFEVSDIWLLARSHPSCVTIEPRRSEIKALLNAGVTVAGIAAKRVVKSGVRLTREQAAIAA